MESGKEALHSLEEEGFAVKYDFAVDHRIPFIQYSPVHSPPHLAFPCSQ
jgi:hypothetical protein